MLERLINIRKYFLYLIYTVFFSWLPDSEHCKIAQLLRAGVARFAISSMGHKVNINHGARFGIDLIIGDRSGIGRDSFVQKGTIIGKNVMMGP